MTAAATRIVLDARKVADFGIGSYVKGLVEGFSRIELPGELLLAGEAPAAELARAHGLGFLPLRARGYSLREQLCVPRLARRVDAALWHFPHYVTPLLQPGSFVVTVHDLIHVERPGDRSPLAYPYALLFLTRAIEQARIVVTATAAAAGAIARLVPHQAEKLRVVPHAVLPDLLQEPTPDEREAARRATGGGPYLLFVGNEMPHKNLAAILRTLPEVLPLLGPGGRLVLAGVAAGPERPWAREASRLGVGSHVVALGRVETGLLRALYAGTSAFVFPSLAEGFGLPPLEALAQGAPVLASAIAPLTEVLGDAADYFDPADPSGAGPALAHLLASPEGPEVRARRRARAHRFTWEASARSTAACYVEALSVS